MPSFDQEPNPASTPSPWILRFLHLIRPGGPVLDVACGAGRHSRLLLERGFAVTAADLHTDRVSDLAGHPAVRIVTADLEGAPWPFAPASFAGIVVTNYLHRPHFPLLAATLQPGGVLLIDTFGQGNERFGKPRNPDFLLAPGELAAAFGGRLQIVACEHGIESLPRPAVRERLCAVRGDEPLPLAP